jgi:ornithine cyclodeaminase
MPADFPVIEFADVVSGRATGRAGDREVTIFDSVGFALEDFSALHYLHRLHRADRASRATIDIVPTLDNPKDLFALLRPRQSQPRAASHLRVSA